MSRRMGKPPDWRKAFDQLIALFEQNLSDPTIDCLEKRIKRMGFGIVTEKVENPRPAFRVTIICEAKTKAAGRNWVLDERTIEPDVAAN